MTTLLMLFSSVTVQFGLPVGLLPAICYVESHHNILATHKDDGRGTSLGVCQIKLPTARMMGFKGSEKELMDPSNNVYYAGKYLRYNLNRYSQNRAKAIAAYNAGSFRTDSTGKAFNYGYVRKVYAAWLLRK